MNHSPHLDSEEACIQDAIGQFYSFFGRMVNLKNEVERLVEVNEQARANLLDQLDDIEREYKDSQEWFISRDVQDVRVGVVGTDRSQKTALVSLFVEGVLEIEGDEKDGRSKSKITVDGKCKLLLIREETGYPSKQLSQWADVLLLAFSFRDLESLLQLTEIYRAFRETRENPNVPVLLVGIRGGSPPIDDPQARTVKEGEVHKTQEMLDKCPFLEVALNQQHVYSLFAHACRLALTTSYFSTTTCPIPISFPSSPSQSSLSGGATHMKFTAIPPASPSHSKRNRKKPGFSFGGAKGSYSVKTLTSLSESFGSGRHIPVKEGSINKKSTGGLRPEWKKKYLVLSKEELTYYPSLNDYMAMTHGKSLNLQLISVKVPGSHTLSFSRSSTGPLNNSNPTTADSYLQPSAELTQPGSDVERSNSVSPTPFDEFISVIPPAKVTPTHGRHRETHSPASPEELSQSDSVDEAARLKHQFESLMMADRGHNRNSSMDEMTLQQLRTGGMTYHQPEEGSDRAATLSRLQGKKMKERPGKGSYLAVLQPGSEELLSDSITGSVESLGKPEKKRKGDKDRNSWMEASGVGVVGGGAKDKKGKGHKRQRSWAGNKLLDAQEQPAEAVLESCEFQILSLDGKVWCFETSTPEETLSWVRAVENQIKKSLSESVSHKRVNSVNDLEKQEMYTMEGNEFCADCNSPNPEWGSVNYGCVLCIECSGVHRKLGSHISRVRSLSLDEWSPELIAVMLSIGNKISKSIFEGKRPRNKPIYSSPREERERFIRAKYIDKEFLLDLPESVQPISEQLLEAVRSDRVVECLHLLAHCSPDDINRLHEAAEGCSPLHLACSLGRTVTMQLLIWHGADINLLDLDKHSPLYYARAAGHRDCVNILIASNCNDSPGSSDTGSTEVLQAPVT